MSDTPDKTVEAVARAICLARLMEQYPTDTADYLQEIVGREWELWRPEARAAIKAHLECLMEPSEEMVTAGHEVRAKLFGSDPTSIFQAMLSAKEKTDEQS